MGTEKDEDEEELDRFVEIFTANDNELTDDQKRNSLLSLERIASEIKMRRWVN
jgi:hypothetical protein